MADINQVIFLAMFALSTCLVCYIGYKGRVENLPAVLILPISTSAMVLILMMGDSGDDLLFIIGLALLGMFLLMIAAFVFLMYFFLRQIKAGLNENTDRGSL